MKGGMNLMMLMFRKLPRAMLSAKELVEIKLASML